MKRTMNRRGEKRPTCLAASYRLRVVTLEDRLPLGGTLLGAMFAGSLLGPSLNLLDLNPDTTASAEDRKVTRLGPPLVSLETKAPTSRADLVPSFVFSSFQGEPTPPPGTRGPEPDWGIWKDLANAPSASLVSSNNAIVSARRDPQPLAGEPSRHPALSQLAAPLHSPDAARPTDPALSAEAVFSETLPTQAATPPVQAKISDTYGTLPLSFETNLGQTDSQVQYLSRGPGYMLFLNGTEAVMALSPKQGSGKGQGRKPQLQLAKVDTPATVVRMQVLGGNAAPRTLAQDPLPGKVNYFMGNDPSQWRTNVPTYAKIEYQNVYPGINLMYYGKQGELEYDFVVASGADPHAIRLGFTGADTITIDNQGDLVLQAGGREIHQHKPVVYQEVNGVRQEIASAFALSTDPSRLTLHQVGFTFGTYDFSRPLVIDPVLSYSTYLGGSNGDFGYGIAVDTAGAAYLTGWTASIDFPTANPFQPVYGGGDFDAFVTKLSPDGASLVYSTYLGGSSYDVAIRIAVDAAGNAYITGSTSSLNFPTVNAFQPTLEGDSDAFVTKLSSDGASLVYSTYLGGSNDDGGEAIAVDAAGNAYVTGSTSSLNFPTVDAFQATFGGGDSDAFVTKLSADGATLVYSSYLGGGKEDVGWGIAADQAGNAHVTGETHSTNFPTASPFQATYGGGDSDAFVTKLSTDGASLVYSTYLGGSGFEAGYGIAVDAAGSAYITGSTSSPNFPTANPLQPTYGGGGSDAFVTKLSADGASLVYSTYLGGSGHEYGDPIAVDAAGNAYITGETQSTDFPTADAFQPTYGGGDADAFVTKLSANAASLVYSTYLGGSNDDAGYGIALDVAGNAYVTGETDSFDFPTTQGAFDTSCGTDGNCNAYTYFDEECQCYITVYYYDAFVTKIGDS